MGWLGRGGRGFWRGVRNRWEGPEKQLFRGWALDGKSQVYMNDALRDGISVEAMVHHDTQELWSLKRKNLCSIRRQVSMA